MNPQAMMLWSIPFVVTLFLLLVVDIDGNGTTEGKKYCTDKDSTTGESSILDACGSRLAHT